MALAESFVRSGKVRDIFAIDPERLLLVASDRLSAFDVVLPTVIPDKGKVLTGLSRYWFAATGGIVANHLLSTDPAQLPEAWVASAPASGSGATGDLRGRMMICRRAAVLPVEVIVRGYLAGSGWKEYVRSGTVCGIDLPSGLRESDRLPSPLFTPSTKAEAGAHDENISFDAVVAMIGGSRAEQLREVALRLYQEAASRTERVGILLADTKFEFGLVADGAAQQLLLVDEVLTPDSSRFWDAGSYAPGGQQPSFDKQYVRDWLERRAWNKAPPGPELPPEIVAGTRERYVAAFERITGGTFASYVEEDRIAS